MKRGRGSVHRGTGIPGSGDGVDPRRGERRIDGGIAASAWWRRRTEEAVSSGVVSPERAREGHVVPTRRSRDRALPAVDSGGDVRSGRNPRTPGPPPPYDEEVLRVTEEEAGM